MIFCFFIILVFLSHAYGQVPGQCLNLRTTSQRAFEGLQRVLAGNCQIWVPIGCDSPSCNTNPSQTCYFCVSPTSGAIISTNNIPARTDGCSNNGGTLIEGNTCFWPGWFDFDGGSNARVVTDCSQLTTCEACMFGRPTQTTRCNWCRNPDTGVQQCQAGNNFNCGSNSNVLGGGSSLSS
jgi:hypothetical protein